MKKVLTNIQIFAIIFLILSAPLAGSEQKNIRTEPAVTGIGGIFFVSENPEKTKEWYRENLGLKTDKYGAVFEFRNALDSSEINYLRWSVFKKGAAYFTPSDNNFMINYRVNNIKDMVRRLKEKGIKMLDKISSYPYGKFVHFLDIDGNKVELWEPVDSYLTKLKGKTNK